ADRARDGVGGIELVDQRSGGIEAIHPSHAVLTGGSDERLAIDDRDGGAEAAAGRAFRRGERVAEREPVVGTEDVGRAGVLALRVVTRRADEDALIDERERRAEAVTLGDRPARLDQRRDELAVGR